MTLTTGPRTTIGDMFAFTKSASDLTHAVEAAALSGETDRLKVAAAAMRTYLDALEEVATGTTENANTPTDTEENADDGMSLEKYDATVREAARRSFPNESMEVAMSKLARSGAGRDLRRRLEHTDLDAGDGETSEADAMPTRAEVRALAKSENIPEEVALHRLVNEKNTK